MEKEVYVPDIRDEYLALILSPSLSRTGWKQVLKAASHKSSEHEMKV